MNDSIVINLSLNQTIIYQQQPQQQQPFFYHLCSLPIIIFNFIIRCVFFIFVQIFSPFKVFLFTSIISFADILQIVFTIIYLQQCSPYMSPGFIFIMSCSICCNMFIFGRRYMSIYQTHDTIYRNLIQFTSVLCLCSQLIQLLFNINYSKSTDTDAQFTCYTFAQHNIRDYSELAYFLIIFAITSSFLEYRDNKQRNRRYSRRQVAPTSSIHTYLRTYTQQQQHVPSFSTQSSSNRIQQNEDRFFECVDVNLDSLVEDDVCSICIIKLRDNNSDPSSIIDNNNRDQTKHTSSVVQLNCQHKFHLECITKWFSESKTTCPLCRTEIVVNQHF